MTDAELLAAIMADATAKGFADIGNDSACAIRMSAILPPVLVPTYLNERGVFSIFANPSDAEAVMTGLATVATSNPVVARALTWLAPNNGGIDLSNASVRTMLDSLVGTLTSEAVATLKSAAEVPQVVSVDQVSRCLLVNRPEGKVV